MNTIEEIIEKLETEGISVHEYKENGGHCGYELNTYTNAGVNQIIFLDFRNTEFDPKNVEDFLEVYNERIESIDIDEEIEINRQDENFKSAFSLETSIQDFKEWKLTLESIFKTSNSKTAEQRQFEQVKDKFQSLLAEMEETLKLMPLKGNTPSQCQRTTISNQLGGLDHCINGIELEDFTPNEYSQDWELSYS